MLCSCSAEDGQQEANADDVAGTPTFQSIEGPDSTPVKTPIATTQPFESQTPLPTQEVQTSTPQTERPVGVVRNSGEIIGTGVAFREGPSVDSGLIERLDHGTVVQILKVAFREPTLMHSGIRLNITGKPDISTGCT